ncbi:MAG: glycerophosphodiester phosphodiesterase family protein [Ilumatobacteraceae bacterium]
MIRRAALASLLLVLAACSSSGDSSSPSTTGAPDTTTAETSAPTTTIAESTTTTEPAPQYAATIDDLLAIGRPIVLAHTAGEDEFPASTLYSFGESVKAGVDMLDLNINLTKDDDLLVQHDDTVDRNTDGTGKVRDFTAAELAKLDGAYWFSTACADCRDKPEGDYLYRGIRTGEQDPPAGYTADDFALPTLRQLVERFPDIPLNIEIKGEGDIAKKTADVLAAQLEELGRGEASVVASFSDEVVSYYHSIDPDTEVSPGLNVLTAYVLNSTPIPDGMRILQLPPEFSGVKVITPELIARATTDGNPIWVWPNNRDLENFDSYLDFLQQGVVGLNINFPEQGVRAVEAYLRGSAVSTAASAGCDSETPTAPGTYPGTLDAAGLPGTYTSYLPPAYDGATPLPVVLGLHGWTQTPGLLATESDLPARSAAWRFVAVTPDITREVPHWETDVDGGDVQWFGALLDRLEQDLCIDTNRIYVTGMSNGAMMTSTLACALADRLAAAALVAGITDPTGCAPSRPVPFVAFHGTDDPYLAYDGGVGDKALTLPAADGNGTIGDQSATTGTSDLAGAIAAPVPDRVAAWATRNGCTTPAPEATATATDDIDMAFYEGCTAPAEFYSVAGGGHTWPGSTFDQAIVDLVGATTTSIDATTVMWQFFMEHPLSA